MQRSQVKSAIEEALKVFFQKDSYLLQVDSSERSITHRIAIHLSVAIAKWSEKYDVDCEFNRNGRIPKRLSPPPEKEKDVTVYPDIIIHRRGRSSENLAVIEFKKSTSTESAGIGHYDKTEKIPKYCFELNYSYGFFVLLPAGTDFDSGQRYAMEEIPPYVPEAGELR